ncbi:RF-1 domain-containing protein [Auriculariales sp. MPI-PUGE-AT-0066]|nr:RF-1 domain-containing protein [Auriculariales sp. MPI-PUGE-AT-0066]
MNSAFEARAVYRLLARTARSTFRGDPVVRREFMRKSRVEYMPTLADDPLDFAAKLAFAREVEHVLRTNIVQATRTSAPNTFKLHFTPDTELGDNAATKTAPPPDPNRPRMSCKDAAVEYAKQGWGGISKPHLSSSKSRSFCTSVRAAKHKDVAKTPLISNFKSKSKSDEPEPEPELSQPNGASGVPRNLSQLKKAALTRVIPELREEDLREAFVRGGGPGGQSINKTRNNVQLLHIPTRIRVDCQLTRSLEDNRRIARIWLRRKLDEQINPGLAKSDVTSARKKERKRQKDKKRRKAEREKAIAAGLPNPSTDALAAGSAAFTAKSLNSGIDSGSPSVSESDELGQSDDESLDEAEGSSCAEDSDEEELEGSWLWHEPDFNPTDSEFEDEGELFGITKPR